MVTVNQTLNDIYRLQKNIKLEQWPQVIQDYKKAKALFAETTVAVFAKVHTQHSLWITQLLQVLAEVEEIAKNVRQLLYTKLEKLPMALSVRAARTIHTVVTHICTIGPGAIH